MMLSQTSQTAYVARYSSKPTYACVFCDCFIYDTKESSKTIPCEDLHSICTSLKLEKANFKPQYSDNVLECYGIKDNARVEWAKTMVLSPTAKWKAEEDGFNACLQCYGTVIKNGWSNPTLPKNAIANGRIVGDSLPKLITRRTMDGTAPDARPCVAVIEMWMAQAMACNWFMNKIPSSVVMKRFKLQPICVNLQEQRKEKGTVAMFAKNRTSRMQRDEKRNKEFVALQGELEDIGLRNGGGGSSQIIRKMKELQSDLLAAWIGGNAVEIPGDVLHAVLGVNHVMQQKEGAFGRGTGMAIHDEEQCRATIHHHVIV